ncbi:hypothetical protein ABZ871_40510 [Streptomyces populi]
MRGRRGAECQRERDQLVRHWIPDKDEPDEYDQQLRREEAAAETAEQQRMTAWIDNLTNNEWEELQQQTKAAAADRNLRAELTASTQAVCGPDN